ncbi:reverse transcriptase family protein [Tenacibaculum sp. ZS6-P6]|uniref:reverse transcriptase family protein n=1 Tax=Tenacibaculum sp. ZS6-P6 TaxID=3447503 RepID=UPI003F97754B
MNNSATRKQEIYDKIKESSKDEYILSEMKRLGFWKEGSVDFEKVNAFLKEERELSNKLHKLTREQKNLTDTEAFIARKHSERKKLSKERQKETKLRREELKKAKAEKWKQTKEEDIIYLGKGFSHQLNHTDSNVGRLNKNGLPIYNSVKDLAKAMGISVNELRFLAFSRKNSKISHYKRFKVAKKTGGFRLISAPMPRLKKAQHFILENILNKVTVHEKAHGCVQKKSIVSNAALHVNKAVVINQDLQNFFPSVTYNRIKGVYKSLGYSEQLSVIFALLCSEPKILDISLLGENYYTQRGDRSLPQGSPCSPAITNILCKKLDFRLDGLAKKYGFTFSRYVDDITFSGDVEQFPNITAILKYSKKIIREENFKLHPDKLRVMKQNQRQEVTGIVVNEKININKKSLKRFRALLFQIENEGLEGKTWNGGANVLAEIDGFANYIYQVDKLKGEVYKERVKNILNKYEYKEQHKAKFLKEKKDSKSKIGGIFKKISSFFRR